MDIPGVGALALVAAEWLGLGWLSGADFADRHPASWALRALVGALLVGLAQLGLALGGIGFSSPPLVLATAALGAGVLRLLRRRAALWQEGRPSLERRERLGWLLLGGVLLAASVRSLLVPEAGWDAYSHWGLRAQAFALAGTVVDAHSEHEYYPPLVPLLEAWLYLQRGAVSLDLGKSIWAVFGSAFGVCLAWHLRRSLRLAWLAPYAAAGIVLGTTAFVESFWTGQADLALAVSLTLATLAVLQWQRTPDRAWLVQAALFGAAAALTKFEGLPRVGVLATALLLEAALSRTSRPVLAAVVLLGAGGMAALGWTALELSRGISPNGEHIGQLQPLALGGVLLGLLAALGGVRSGGGVLVAILAWAVSWRRLWCGPHRLLVLVTLGQLAATLIAFLVSSTSPEIEVRTSATRLFEQFMPLALYVAAVGLVGEAARGSGERDL